MRRSSSVSSAEKKGSEPRSGWVNIHAVEERLFSGPSHYPGRFNSYLSQFRDGNNTVHENMGFAPAFSAPKITTMARGSCRRSTHCFPAVRERPHVGVCADSCPQAMHKNGVTTTDRSDLRALPVPNALCYVISGSQASGVTRCHINGTHGVLPTTTRDQEKSSVVEPRVCNSIRAPLDQTP